LARAARFAQEPARMAISSSAAAAWRGSAIMTYRAMKELYALEFILLGRYVSYCLRALYVAGGLRADEAEAAGKENSGGTASVRLHGWAL
jgi:hypothetical protein